LYVYFRILLTRYFPQNDLRLQDVGKCNVVFQNPEFVCLCFVYSAVFIEQAAHYFWGGFFSTCVIKAGGVSRYRLSFMYELSSTFHARSNWTLPLSYSIIWL